MSELGLFYSKWYRKDIGREKKKSDTDYCSNDHFLLHISIKTSLGEQRKIELLKLQIKKKKKSN